MKIVNPFIPQKRQKKSGDGERRFLHRKNYIDETELLYKEREKKIEGETKNIKKIV